MSAQATVLGDWKSMVQGSKLVALVLIRIVGRRLLGEGTIEGVTG